MNKTRRQLIQSAIDKMEEIKSSLEALMEEEQEYKDNMPESFQDGEKGEAADEAISNLESAIDSIQEAIDSAQEATT